MDVEVLHVVTREKTEKASDIRRAGWIPAEFYGHGIDNVSLKVEYQTFRKLYRKAGENTVLELNLPDKKKLSALVHQLDLDPVTDVIRHIDFINVRMDEEVHTHIPVQFVGVSPAVKEQGGVFTVMSHDLEVKCLPKDLVHGIEVDISGLVEVGASLHFSDVVMPKGMTMLNAPENTLAMVVAPRVESAEDASAPVVSAADVPVAGAEKKEESGD